MSKIYPIGIQSFEVIRRDGYFYVDKTSLVYRLVTSGKYYFLSRPRRFGKSLLISLWRPISEGRRSCLMAWRWRNWRMNGKNIRCCTWT